METLIFKRGDTFSLSCSTDQDITGYTITSQVRTKTGQLVAQLTPNITQTTPTGIYTLTATSTQTWPVAVLKCDIQYVTGSGVVVSTDTFEIDVKEDITRP